MLLWGHWNELFLKHSVSVDRGILDILSKGRMVWEMSEEEVLGIIASSYKLHMFLL